MGKAVAALPRTSAFDPYLGSCSSQVDTCDGAPESPREPLCPAGVLSFLVESSVCHPRFSLCGDHRLSPVEPSSGSQAIRGQRRGSCRCPATQ